MIEEIVAFGNHIYAKVRVANWPEDYRLTLEGEKWHAWEVKVSREPGQYFVLMIRQEEFDKRMAK